MKERGFLDSNAAIYLIGLSIAVWVISMVMGWIYETKEQRTARTQRNSKTQFAQQLTKEQVVKFGIGEFEATCSGLFLKRCRVSMEN